eukprot:415963-Pelagomonas_calceolata.AAC.1
MSRWSIHFFQFWVCKELQGPVYVMVLWSCTAAEPQILPDAGRRDIGKSETWGAKDAEGKGRAVTCLTCGHKWEADMQCRIGCIVEQACPFLMVTLAPLIRAHDE